MVPRLSILFNNEKEDDLRQRKEICEKRRKNVEDTLLFTRYISNVPLSKISNLPQKWEKKLILFLKFSRKCLNDKNKRVFSINSPNMIKQMSIVKQDFIQQMKKIRVIMEMQEINNQIEFNARSLKYRNIFKKIRVSNKAVVSKFPEFKERRIFIQCKSHFEDPILVKLIIDFLNQCEIIKKKPLIFCEIDSANLPYKIDDFKNQRDKFNDKYDPRDISQKFKNLIMERLRDKVKDSGIKKVKVYDFFMTEKENYPNSKIKKILEFFNLILHNKIKELTDVSISMFLEFLRKYYTCQDRDKNYLEKSVPLFVIHLLVYNDISENNDKDDNKESNSRSKTLVFEPKLSDFESTIMKTFNQIVYIINNIQDLMSLSIKIVPPPKRNVFLLDENYKVYKDALKEIEEIVSFSIRECRTIKERYKIFVGILNASEKSYIKKHIFEGKDTLNLKNCKMHLEKLYDLKKKLSEFDIEINLKMFRIITSKLNTIIKEKIEQLMKAIV